MTATRITWTCAVCGERVQVPATSSAIASTPWDPVATVRVQIDDIALADVYAHAWQHEQEHST